MTTRAPIIRATYEAALQPNELVVDNFAGGGGASTGIEAAIGRPCDIAINHDAEAIALHKANHPMTKHFIEDIWAVDPREACGGRPVGLAWFSPDCTHFSRAKGQTPVKKEIRGLAWVVIRWAKTVKPRIIVLENVQEFTTWGPLVETPKGLRPDPGKKGATFRQWLGKLKALGYTIEFTTLTAADYGTPTIRKRLYLVARRDGGAPVWPRETHGPGTGNGYIPAHEIIDWTLPTTSIFGRARPLAQATLNRIAEGIRRYVLEDPEPFIVRHGHYSTRTGAGLIEGCGAGTFRGQPLTQPLATVCATNDKHLVVPHITKHYGGMVGHRVDRCLGTITASDHHALTAALLQAGEVREADPAKEVEVRAFLTKYYGGGDTGLRGTSQGLFEPLHTVRAKACFGLIEVAGTPYRIVDVGMRMLQPHELFAAQGFPARYRIDTDYQGKPLTKTAQMRLCGNAVCPPVAERIVAANLGIAPARAA